MPPEPDRKPTAKAPAAKKPPGAARKVQTFREQDLALTRLTKSKALANADIAALLREVTEVVSAMIGVERASIWVYVHQRQAIRCADLFEKSRGSHAEGAELLAADYPRYFASLEEQRAIAAHDARTDPRTSEFSESYLVPIGITSMLDAPIRGGEGMAGVICLEHVGPAREWTLEEQSFAASAADALALGFEIAERRRALERLRRSEELYRTLAESFPNGAVLLFDGELRYIIAGGAGIADSGLSQGGLEGKTIREALPKETCDAIEPHYRAALDGEARVFELEFLGRRHEVHVVPVRDEKGTVTAGMVMTQDVTARRRAEDEVRRNAKILAEAQSMAHLGVFEWRAEDNKVTWSEELYNIFGLRADEFDGRFEGFLSHVHPDDRDAVAQTIKNAYQTGTPFQQEERIIRPDGSVRVLASTGEPVVDDWGEVLGILGICRDVTEVREAQRLQEAYSRTLEEQVAERTRELQEKQAQLVQSAKMASLGSLVAGVVHEINNPLGAMVASNDLVRRSAVRVKNLLDTFEGGDEESRAKLRDLAERIEEAEDVSRVAGLRMSGIIASLREFAQLDQPEEDRVDLHKGIESTLELLSHLIRERIDLRRQYSSLPRVHCRPTSLNQVFMNLLLNAVQAIPERGTITIKTSVDGSRAVVEIADTGVGIPQNHLDRIFDPGFTTKGVKVGTGLGLAIVHRIIEEHGGTIDVQSEVGAGSTFRISLPVDGTGKQPRG